MVNLYNVGTYNANTGFKVGYLNELERIGKDNSGFGWDEHKHMVVAEDAVCPKAASQFRNCSFPYYDQLTSIYAKD
ncbi:hypothetical protein Godav_011117 [Gossypium davidsonii]|uniref:Myb/SANT-like domain-containing protein n=1 Tax=Gossypium davidsonii TaxID=34287 RepID=A0A7J8R8U3_GOSDV|nr:hypothetical protein [Gossypium davidsonii]